MGVITPISGASPFAAHLADEMRVNAGKMEDYPSSIETRESTKSPDSGPHCDPEESLVMEDDSALAMMGPPTLGRLTTDENLMGPPTLGRLTTDDQYFPAQAPMDPAFGMVEMVQESNGLPLENIMQQQAPEMAPRQMEPMHYQEVAPMEMQQQHAPMEMRSNRPMPAMQQNNSPEVDMNNGMQAPVSPNNNTMMYSDVMMQQAMQQALQQGHMQQHYGQNIQYVPVPTPVPVQMMPQMMQQMVPVPMPMNFPMPGQQMQMPYYMVPQGAEQQREEAPKSGEFLEALMPKGWRKRQRPSKRPASRVQKVPNGRKIFVGGLSPNSTAESLIKHFCEFGKISDASVIHEAVSRKSRGFGYVEFADKIPDGLLEMEHFIDQRRCGVRGYNYDPADDVVVAASAA
jgi:hypothetical protein